MFRSSRRELALAMLSLAPFSAHSQATPSTPATPPANAASAPTLDKVEVTGQRERLDAARNGLSPETGSTIYRFSQQDIANLPLGENTPLNQVVLQAPGVVQDSYGQLHVRGDHSNVQYRIDGVVIPESISGFGQSLETRFADRISVLTGALPAQYGYRTAAIVDIKTKGQEIGNGGSVGVTFGSHGHIETSGEIGGTQGNFSYYLTGSYLDDKMGIENPTPERDALHDRTNQGKGFGYLSYVLNDTNRISLMFGVSDNHFEIPNVPGQPPQFSLAGSPSVNSATLDATQRERNSFEILSYQGEVADKLDYQVSLFHRDTDVHYQPDAVGDLVFNGIAADVLRRNSADGVQADLSYPIADKHTLRGGLFVQQERFKTDNTSSVFPADGDGNQTSDVPMQITDNTSQRGHLWGVYLQDEWQPTSALTVNYGLRYDQVNTVVDENQLSPRIGVVYDLSPTLRLHAGYARYFTPPPTEKIDTTSVALFQGTTNALPSDANTAVRSERSDYYDAGLALQVTPQLTLGIDGYYRNVQHLQDEGQFGNALIYSAFNYAKGRIYGLELSANYKGPAWAAYGNLAFSRAMAKQIETGQFNFDADELAYINNNWVHLDHDQQVTASAGISYRFADTTTLSGDALYGSGLRNDFANTGHLPSYTQVNAAVSRSFDLGAGFGKIDARLSMLNVFDRVYELRDGSGIGVGAPQYGPRRTVFVGFSKNF